MRAAIITRPGPPDVLEIREVPTPVAGAHEVLVRVIGSALNRADLLQRVGRYPPPPGAPADVPGIEFAGEVSGVGEGVSRWRAGDRVFGLVGGGAHAELVTAHEATIARVPHSMSWRDAGAAPEAFITAYDAMVTQARVQPGERVLIHAVGSGVGLAAVQVARAWGAIPYGTSRTADKIAHARTLGLEDGIALGGSLADMLPATQRWTGGRGMDVILDLVGGAYVSANVECAAARARIMLIGAVAGSEATVDVRRILGKRLTLRGTVLRSRGLEERIAVADAFARDLVPRLADGTLRAVIDRDFPLEAITDAHAYMESNATTGKVSISIAG